MNKLYNISELAKILKLIDTKTKKPLNHTLRYWEKEFKEIKPKIINKRRYYSFKQVEVIKKIKFLLKDKGMTILGVKNLLKLNTNKLDENNLNSLKRDHYRSFLKSKIKTILKKINKIKIHGKKNTS
jgi:DNA-binding transcriptional MerR regulator